MDHCRQCTRCRQRAMTRIRVSLSLSSGSSMSCNTGDLLSSMFSPLLARTFTNLACVLFILRNYAVLFSVLVFFFPPWTCFYFLCIFISRLNPCFTLFHLDTLPSGHPPIWTPSPSLCLLPEQWQAGEHEEADQVVWVGHDGHFHAARHSGAVQSCESDTGGVVYILSSLGCTWVFERLFEAVHCVFFFMAGWSQTTIAFSYKLYIIKTAPSTMCLLYDQINCVQVCWVLM